MPDPIKAKSISDVKGLTSTIAYYRAYDTNKDCRIDLKTEAPSGDVAALQSMDANQSGQVHMQEMIVATLKAQGKIDALSKIKLAIFNMAKDFNEECVKKEMVFKP